MTVGQVDERIVTIVVKGELVNGSCRAAASHISQAVFKGHGRSGITSSPATVGSQCARGRVEDEVTDGP